MDMLEGLNEGQKRAATCIDGPVVVLAGAGSGKTKMLLARTLYIMTVHKRKKLPVPKILLVTFTNKAAAEMKERLLAEVDGAELPNVSISTFHSWCLKLLRFYANSAKGMDITSTFQIIQESEQNTLLKALTKSIWKDSEDDLYLFDNEEIKLPKWGWLGNFLGTNILSYEDEIQTSKEIKKLVKAYEKSGKGLGGFEKLGIDIHNTRDRLSIARLFCEYKKALRASNLVDFDDLIHISGKMMEENEQIRARLSEHYSYMMVDEFQDTNASQIKLLDQLINKKENICVVGDDSQSIYGFRGADSDYIINFDKRFELAEKINLTINYRSGSLIIEAANSLISNAPKADFKEALVSFTSEEGKILVDESYGQKEEARGVARNMKKIIDSGITSPSNIAVLYRTNMWSREIEAELIRHNIPYEIYKGRSLLQKASIQGYISLLNLVSSSGNNIAMENVMISSLKVANAKTIMALKLTADSKGVDLYDLVFSGDFDDMKLTPKPKQSLLSFSAALKEARNNSEMPLGEYLGLIEREFGYDASFRHIIETTSSDKTREAAGTALADLEVFFSLVRNYETLEEFLEAISLSEEVESREMDKVQLMTIHASKGLEFEVVFATGFSDGVLPSASSFYSKRALNEERNLAYVAITRAKRYLFVSYIRKMWGKDYRVSRFIEEAGLLTSAF